MKIAAKKVPGFARNTDYFIHVTDTHLQADVPLGWEVLERFADQVSRINPKPAFVVCTGDIVFADMRITTPPEAVEKDFARYGEVLSGMGVPLYSVVGNHDITLSPLPLGTPEYGKELFVGLCGPRYQSFDSGNWHCVILDQWIVRPESPRLTHDIDAEQLDWFERDLSKCAAGTTVLLFVHHPLSGYPELLAKIRKVARIDLFYIEVAGCDHQNSAWNGNGWRSFTGASLCGGWWNGPCIDANPPGYSLMYYDGGDSLKRYYRGIDYPLAVHSPAEGAVIDDSIEVDAIDPYSGERASYTIDCRSMPIGLSEVEIRVGSAAQKATVFRRPGDAAGCLVQREGYVEFEIRNCTGDRIEITLNGRTIGQIHCGTGADRSRRLAVPDGVLCAWNILEFRGDAVISSPHLVCAGSVIRDPRVARLEAVRPDWFGQGKTLTWDIGMRGPKTPWMYLENTFYIQVGSM